MRRALQSTVASLAMVAAAAVTALPAQTARADDLAAVFVGVTAVVTALGWDVAFTVYDGAHLGAKEKSDFNWMLAQTLVTSPQSVLLHVPTVFGAIGKDKDASLIVFLLPVTVWENALTAFSSWSMAKTDVPPGTRFGVSWLIGSNVTFTVASAASFANDHRVEPLYYSIPQALVTGPETAVAIYRSVQDKEHQGPWIGMAVWSGVLFAEATTSILVELAHMRPEKTTPPPPQPVRTPLPAYYDRPVTPLPSGPPAYDPFDPAPTYDHDQPVRIVPERLKVPAPSISPGPVTDGIQLAPGLTVHGRF